MINFVLPGQLIPSTQQEMINKSGSITIYNARTIGILFLLAFLAYGFGSRLFESANTPEKYAGALLIVANSAMVLLIGILLRKH